MGYLILLLVVLAAFSLALVPLAIIGFIALAVWHLADANWDDPEERTGIIAAYVWLGVVILASLVAYANFGWPGLIVVALLIGWIVSQ